MKAFHDFEKYSAQIYFVAIIYQNNESVALPKLLLNRQEV